MKVINIVCIVFACINAAFALGNIVIAKWYKEAKKYHEEVKAAYEAKLHELEEEEQKDA